MDATSRRAELGAELRKARDAAGRTQQEAATFLKCTQSKITKIETGAVAVKRGDLEQLLQLYRPSEKQQLKIKKLAEVPGPGITEAAREPHTAYVRMLEREKRANLALALHSERIPRPLQSEKYRFMQYFKAGDKTPQNELLLDRNRAAEIFTDPERRSRYHVLLSESALHRLPGGRTPDLVIDQAEYLLLSMARYERLSLHIVTFAAKIPFMDADFTVYKLPNSKDDFAYVDTNVDAHIIEGAQRVADREKYWDLVKKEALTREGTEKWLVDLIEKADAESR